MTWDVSTDSVEVDFSMTAETPIAADWGEIGGDIDEQADLKNRLDAKQDTIPANTYDPYGAASSAVSAHNSANDAHIAKFAAKQDTIADLSTIRSGASAGATAYQKPASGIPSTDMATAVQTSLGKADSALQDAPSDNKQYARKNGAWAEVQGGGGGTSDHAQLTNRDAANQHPISAINGLQAALDGKGTYSKPSGGIPKSDMASDVQTSLGKADTALQEHQSLSAYRTAAQQDAIHDATKQDVISDLATIRSGAALGATAIQEHQSLAGYATQSWVGQQGYLTQHQSLAAYRTAAEQDAIHDATKENTANKVTSISSASTDTQYPSAKCMYDIVGNIESLLEGVL